jgi:hypothetical protein
MCMYVCTKIPGHSKASHAARHVITDRGSEGGLRWLFEVDLLAMREGRTYRERDSQTDRQTDRRRESEIRARPATTTAAVGEGGQSRGNTFSRPLTQLPSSEPRKAGHRWHLCAALPRQVKFIMVWPWGWASPRHHLGGFSGVVGSTIPV